MCVYFKINTHTHTQGRKCGHEPLDSALFECGTSRLLCDRLQDGGLDVLEGREVGGGRPRRPGRRAAGVGPTSARLGRLDLFEGEHLRVASEEPAPSGPATATTATASIAATAAATTATEIPEPELLLGLAKRRGSESLSVKLVDFVLFEPAENAGLLLDAGSGFECTICVANPDRTVFTSSSPIKDSTPGGTTPFLAKNEGSPSVSSSPNISESVKPRASSPRSKLEGRSM